MSFISHRVVLQLCELLLYEDATWIASTGCYVDATIDATWIHGYTELIIPHAMTLNRNVHSYHFCCIVLSFIHLIKIGYK